ncbi:hypothetical protein [Paenibacillus oleatilyticus]|uniref:Uncharacterized protein n=1 Tax=Paenibacillus oleatilyticus TaxID=2594886 RepID=A0ABV4UVG9_9BACL|nr:hypothetical protein [Paenibacillus oleatilyticus]MBU7314762.1 hypothetical protein [Paenibacillus oleatilyticus]
MKLPKRTLLMTVLSIILALSFSTAAFAQPSLIFPKGTSSNPAYISNAPDFFAWNQSPSDNEAEMFLSASNGFHYTVSTSYPAGKTYGNFYLSQGMKDALPRNTPIRVSIKTYSNSVFTGSDTGYFVIQN